MTKPRVTVSTLAAMKERGEPIACLTCYDASFARVLEASGVEVLLVGDSLGNVVQGQRTTIPVTLDQMVYHCACVARRGECALLIADLPFLTYANAERALVAAGRLMQEGGAQMVKLEGGAAMLDTVKALADQGVPVCGHLGLLPQSVHKLGGYRFQGRDPASAKAIHDDALALQTAGAGLLVLECVPASLAQEIAESLAIPVIGIGAGAGCDGQVLVLYDMLGLNLDRPPSFSKNFLQGRDDGVSGAVDAYVRAVKMRAFPGPEQTLA